MAGVSFTLDDEIASAALAQAERALANPREALDAIGAHFVFSTQRNIELETAPGGGKWPRLAKRTADRRIGKGRRGYDHMLRVSARLYQSISYSVLDNSVEWGTNLIYGRIHQLGGVIERAPRQGSVTLKRVKLKKGGIRSRFAKRSAKGAVTSAVSIGAYQIRIPARPYLGITNEDRTAVPEIVLDYLEREIAP